MTPGLATLHCISFGVPFQLTADPGHLLATMRESAPFATDLSAPPSPHAQNFTLRKSQNSYRLTANDEPIAEHSDLQIIHEQLTRDLMVHVANHAPNRVFVHAGVVGWQGHALILPGTSFTGKTTLVAELVRAGATYYSDEYAVLDGHGQVHPYPRELQIRTPGSREQKSTPVEELQGIAGTTPLPVSHVVFAEYAEQAQWRPEPLPAGMAVLEMLRHAIPVQRTPARVMATLAKMMETAVALHSQRNEASETAQSLLVMMGKQ